MKNIGYFCQMYQGFAMKTSMLKFLFLLFPFYCFSQGLTNVGTDFWIAFPPNQSVSASLQIFISSNYATSGSISSAFPGVDQIFNVIPGIVTQVTVPSGVALSNEVENKGIRVTAAEPISVYGLNRNTATTDAYMALPVSSLGVDYRVLAYKTTLNNNGSGVSVVATQNGTVLTVFNHQTGGISNVNLEEGQTYYVTADALDEDLTGSTIQSNYPVAVFGSVKCSQVPAGCFYADHLVEQMFPVSAWGKKFITVPLAGRDGSGDIFRILANENGTDITINGTFTATLGAGEYYETNLADYNSIITSKASLVAQYAKGTQCSGNLTGDPFMVLIPPREQFLTNYTISTVSGFTSHWVNIIAPSYAVGAIYQDGILIPDGSFVPVGTTAFYGAQINITEGSHNFTSLFPFGVFIYGWTNVDSYGYPGGGSLSPVGTVNSVTISPASASGILNVSTVCFTAHVEDDLNNPVADVLVNFNISGINPITGTAYTDANGNAQYCYTQTGTSSGVDQIYAEIFGFNSTISTVDWTYISPCTNPTEGGSIGFDQSGCGNYTPLPIASLTLPAGQTGTPEYKWQQSIVDEFTGFTDIPGSNSAGFSPGIIYQTTWYQRLARVDCMSDWTGAALSNVVEMTVVPELPVEITISVNFNPFCLNTSVTYTAIAVNGGTPSYQWYVNGTPSGPDNYDFSYIPSPGDVVFCMLTSGEPCTVNNPVTSNLITMVPDNSFPAEVSIIADTNPFCTGSMVQYTAMTMNGGTVPTFQWFVNGEPSGTNSSIFTYSPLHGDSIHCIMTSNVSCVSGNPAFSDTIIMSSLAVPQVTFSPCFDEITVVNAKPYKLKGGIPLGGTFSGPGVNSLTSVFSPAIAGAGIAIITYSYTNIYSCSASKTLSINVQPMSNFVCGGNLTDIRDNRTYPSVQIGSQCWMAANLDFGTAIDDFNHQTDNCLAERYTHLSPLIGGPSSFYQWNEMMKYDGTPAGQGLCPPGWHVPAENEWTVLFNFYQGHAVAGKPLQDPTFNGFNAQRSGVFYLSTNWSFIDFATIFWSSTDWGQSGALSFGMNPYNYSVSIYPASRVNAFPVRCLQD